MTIYVDKAVNKYGRMMMCHMVADTLSELHTMAQSIGVQRKWFQDKASTPHYDICKAKRMQAVKLGVKEVNRRELVQILRRLRR